MVKLWLFRGCCKISSSLCCVLTINGSSKTAILHISCSYFQFKIYFSIHFFPKYFQHNHFVNTRFAWTNIGSENIITGFLQTGCWSMCKHIRTYNRVNQVLLGMHLERWRITENGAARAADSWSWESRLGQGMQKIVTYPTGVFTSFGKSHFPLQKRESRVLVFPVRLATGTWTPMLTNDQWGMETARTPSGKVFF